MRSRMLLCDAYLIQSRNMANGNWKDQQCETTDVRQLLQSKRHKEKESERRTWHEKRKQKQRVSLVYRSVGPSSV
jgi:hypothetical protein